MGKDAKGRVSALTWAITPECVCTN